MMSVLASVAAGDYDPVRLASSTQEGKMSEGMIAPERHGLWITVGFILALLALVIGLVNVWRSHTALVGTQIEVLALHRAITKLDKKVDEVRAVANAAKASAPRRAATSTP
jgi:hypothetical protein